MRKPENDLASIATSDPPSERALDRFVAASIGGRWGLRVAILFAILSIAFAGYRACSKYSHPSRGDFDFSQTGMSDFHNGTYYPSIAFRNGVNPYAREVCDVYPMARSAPPYSPVVFMLYSPFSYLPLPVADIAFFAFNVLLMAGLARFCIAMIRDAVDQQNHTRDASANGWLNLIGSDVTASIWLFGWMMFSRPGHITLFTGYFTLQLVFGSVLALHYGRSHPWFSAVGLLLTSGKPTYVIPLTILMLSKRRFKATFCGLVLCTIFGAAGVAWLASHADLSKVVEGVIQGQAEFDNDPTELPSFTWTRLDTMGVVAKLAGWAPSGTVYLAAMLVLLFPVCIFLWRTATRNDSLMTASGEHGLSRSTSVGSVCDGGVGWSACIAYLALLVSIYHHSYDALLASIVWASVLLGGNACLAGLTTRLQRILLVLLTVPAINYAATLSFRDKFQIANDSLLWSFITSLNGACLVISLILMLLASSRQNPKP